jgi:hypothetical protein
MLEQPSCGAVASVKERKGVYIDRLDRKLLSVSSPREEDPSPHEHIALAPPDV